MPAALTLVTCCMGRLAHLRQSLPAMAAQPNCSCVVVDYSCPEQCGDWVAEAFPQVTVVRVPGRASYSPSAARNRGAAAADTPWFCFIDADVIPSGRFA